MAALAENELREVVRKIALLNAVGYGGKARADPVLGKLLAERSQLKLRVKEVASIVEKVVEEVNELSPDEQRKIVEKNYPEELAKERVEKRESFLRCRMCRSICR